MKFKWDKETAFDDSDHNLYVWMDDTWNLIGYIERIGSWWEVSAYWTDDKHEAPNGARFESLRAAKIYMRKHAVVAIVGGYKP